MVEYFPGCLCEASAGTALCITLAVHHNQEEDSEGGQPMQDGDWSRPVSGERSWLCAKIKTSGSWEVEAREHQ